MLLKPWETMGNDAKGTEAHTLYTTERVHQKLATLSSKSPLRVISRDRALKCHILIGSGIFRIQRRSPSGAHIIHTGEYVARLLEMNGMKTRSQTFGVPGAPWLGVAHRSKGKRRWRSWRVAAGPARSHGSHSTAKVARTTAGFFLRPGGGSDHKKKPGRRPPPGPPPAPLRRSRGGGRGLAAARIPGGCPGK